MNKGPGELKLLKKYSQQKISNMPKYLFIIWYYYKANLPEVHVTLVCLFQSTITTQQVKPYTAETTLKLVCICVSVVQGRFTYRKCERSKTAVVFPKFNIVIQ